MFDRSDIQAAIEAGALSNDQAARFTAFLKARNDPERMLDPENLRFLSNFNDVFLTIGIAVLMTGITFLSSQVFLNIFGEDQMKMAILLIPVPVLASAWALAEYFCGRRRLLLPSMALSFVIVYSAAAIVAVAFMPNGQSDNLFSDDFGNQIASVAFAGFGAAAAAALAVFFRFRLPFSLFLLALSVAGLFYTAIARFADGDLIFGGVATLTVGLATLAAAIIFDMRDPLRASRNSDNAFWLHMAAAPQIMFGLRGLILGSGFAPAGMADAAIMLSVLIAFGLLSLALNRRALIVSGLLSFAASLWVLVDKVGGGGLNTVMLTALIVGASIVLLGGGWKTARRGILKLIPSGGVSGRIFPPEPA